MLGGPLALLDEYGGGVRERSQSEAAVAALGEANAVLLANHGVLVVARDMRQAYLRAIAVEHRCRVAWHVEALGGGTPMPEDFATVGGRMMDENGWRGASRRWRAGSCAATPRSSSSPARRPGSQSL